MKDTAIQLKFLTRAEGAYKAQENQVSLRVISELTPADLKVLWDFEQLVNSKTGARLHVSIE